jgi:hypothetical protein
MLKERSVVDLFSGAGSVLSHRVLDARPHKSATTQNDDTPQRAL